MTTSLWSVTLDTLRADFSIHDLCQLDWPKAKLQAGFVWLHFHHCSIYHAPPRWLQSCLLAGGAVKQVSCAKVSAANSTRSPSQILLSTFLCALLMQIHVNTQDLKALGNTSESSKLIRQGNQLICPRRYSKIQHHQSFGQSIKKKNTTLQTPLSYVAAVLWLTAHCLFYAQGVQKLSVFTPGLSGPFCPPYLKLWDIRYIWELKLNCMFFKEWLTV